MREYKFRGKRVDNGEWVYGYYFCGYQKYSYIESKEYKHWIEGYDEEGYYFVYEVIPETVGQFTGLHDKNGVEIYEGDVATYTDNNNQTGKVGVYFENGTFLIFKGLAMLALHLADLSKLEVIGNIHEEVVE